MNRRDSFKATAGALLAWCGIKTGATQAAPPVCHFASDGEWVDGQWVFPDGSRMMLTAHGGKGFHIEDHRLLMPDYTFAKRPWNHPVWYRVISLTSPEEGPNCRNWLERYESLYAELPPGMYWSRNVILPCMRAGRHLYGINAQMEASWCS